MDKNSAELRVRVEMWPISFKLQPLTSNRMHPDMHCKWSAFCRTWSFEWRTLFHLKGDASLLEVHLKEFSGSSVTNSPTPIKPCTASDGFPLPLSNSSGGWRRHIVVGGSRVQRTAQRTLYATQTQRNTGEHRSCAEHSTQFAAFCQTQKLKGLWAVRHNTAEVRKTLRHNTLQNFMGECET